MSDFPSFLILTGEKLAKIAEEQGERRERTGFRAILSPVEQKVEFARRREVAIREGIRALLGDPSLDGAEKESRIAFEMERIASALAEQGRYHEALVASPDGARAEEYQAIIDAIEKDDSEECGCEDEERHDLGPHAVRLPRHYIHDYIYSYRHGRETPVIRCSQCGHLNARPAPQSIHHVLDAHNQSANSGEAAQTALARVLGGGLRPDGERLRHA